MQTRGRLNIQKKRIPYLMYEYFLISWRLTIFGTKVYSCHFKHVCLQQLPLCHQHYLLCLQVYLQGVILYQGPMEGVFHQIKLQVVNWSTGIISLPLKCLNSFIEIITYNSPIYDVCLSQSAKVLTLSTLCHRKK